MSLTIQQILLDSERLAIRLKEDDSAADVLLSQTQNVYKQIDAMKQYAEETGELNELARQRPHSVLVAGIQQESRHLRELQQENRELRAALEEHQNALEVIMSKYRQQVTHLVQVSKLNLTNLYNSQYTQVIRRQAEKMNEMAAVMKMAAEIDEKNATQDKEVHSRLSTENQGLRELLDISLKFGSLQVKSDDDKKVDDNLKNEEDKLFKIKDIKNIDNNDKDNNKSIDNDNDDADDDSSDNDIDANMTVVNIKFDDKTVIRKKGKNSLRHLLYNKLNSNSDDSNKINSNNSTNNTTIPSNNISLINTKSSSSTTSLSSPGAAKLSSSQNSIPCTVAVSNSSNTTTTSPSSSLVKDSTVKK